MVFYTGTNLPTHYREGAFVGEHGSWDRTVLNGYKVVYVPFDNGRPAGPPKTSSPVSWSTVIKPGGGRAFLNPGVCRQ
jgi:glucose/arabinose dehydrogenase